MTDNKYHKSAKAFRLAGRIIGLIVAAFILIFLIGETANEISDGGWKALLLLASIGIGIHIGFSAGRNHFLAWLIVGLPFLITAALLFVGWWLERRGRKV